MDSTSNAIGLLLRDPREVARRCLEEDALKPLSRAALTCIVLGAATFGGAVGSFRGGAQIAYAAVKMPAALIAAIVLCVPAFHAIAATLGRPWPLRTVVALTIAAAGRAALVLLAFAPVFWLLYDVGLSYHAAALAAAGAYAVAGLTALAVLLRAFGDGKHKLVTAAAFVGVFLAAAGQTGWVLRPYLVRPQTEEVPLIREVEGGFADAIYTSFRSSLGIYDQVGDRAAQTSWVTSESLTPRAEDPPPSPPEVQETEILLLHTPTGAYEEWEFRSANDPGRRDR